LPIPSYSGAETLPKNRFLQKLCYNYQNALSYGGASGINPVITAELFGARYSGANYGLVLIGVGLSSVVFGRLAALSAVSGSLSGIFLLCAALCAVPVLMMIFIRRRCKRLGKLI
jgi:OFA family oxalate/formate antiporter-like MFS transporter